MFCFSQEKPLRWTHTHTDTHTHTHTHTDREHQQIDLAKQTYSHLQSLDLADSNPNSLPLDIDILIGANHYWNIIGKHQVRGKFVPVALGSKLGYV